MLQLQKETCSDARATILGPLLPRRAAAPPAIVKPNASTVRTAFAPFRKLVASPCLVKTERHFAVVEEDEVLALVRDESLEVRANDAVPCGAVFLLEFRLRRHRQVKWGGRRGAHRNKRPSVMNEKRITLHSKLETWGCASLCLS